jgi:hypothetical protein
MARLKLKLHDIFANRDFVTGFQKLRKTPLSGKDAYGIHKTGVGFDQERESFEVARKAILDKYRLPAEKEGALGELPIAGSPNANLMMKEIYDLLQQEVEIYLDHKLVINWDRIELNADEASALEVILESPPSVDEAQPTPANVTPLPTQVEAAS